MSIQTRFRLGIVIVMALTAGVLWLVLPPRQAHPVSDENYCRINLGMTRAEVEDILCGPPRVIGKKPRWGTFAPIKYEGKFGPHGCTLPEKAEWISDRGRIIVSYDTSGRVQSKEYYLPSTRR